MHAGTFKQLKTHTMTMLLLRTGRRGRSAAINKFPAGALTQTAQWHARLKQCSPVIRDRLRRGQGTAASGRKRCTLSGQLVSAAGSQEPAACTVIPLLQFLAISGPHQHQPAVPPSHHHNDSYSSQPSAQSHCPRGDRPVSACQLGRISAPIHISVDFWFFACIVESSSSCSASITLALIKTTINTMTAPPPSPPPALTPWWFYTSPLPLDDPLSPLPITTSSTSSTKHPPRPFSYYDARALEKAYQELLISDTPPTDHATAPSQRNDVASEVLKNVTSAAQHKHVRHHRAVTEQLEYAEEGRGHDMLNAPIRFLSNSANFGSTPACEDAPSQMTEKAGAGINPPPVITTNPFIRSISRSRRDYSRSPSPGVNGNAPKRPAPPKVKQKEIPVGIQRLHKVLLPSLTMTPIYWNPLHDISGVCRAIWFYRDTMLPVETDMANRLERGYCEVRAWTEEWEAELESAVQAGRDGEEKIRWKLWDMSLTSASNTPLGGSRPGTSAGKTEPMDIGIGRRFETANKPATPSRRGMFASYSSSWASASSGSRVGTPPPPGVTAAMYPPSAVMATTSASVASSASSIKSSSGNDSPSDPSPTPTSSVAGMSAAAIPNPNDWVIFANAREAYICRDTMLGFGNRRPLATIRSAGNGGNMPNVGIRVVRGFDVVEWERLHPKRKIAGIGKKENGVGAGVAVPSEDRVVEPENIEKPAAEIDRQALEVETDEDDGRQEVSDLILVIHGIGQKLSERVESFHFTHAINSFRRIMNTELRDPAVKPHLRYSMKGMMMLPINWRSGLSFEDGIGHSSAQSSKKKNNYTLENITLGTIPAVRNLIGDVMLDIPYYLSSNYKGKMIDAVVREANRVYGLWKQYNPEWEEKGGRVHLMAHSLGSAIALDVLSKQPTRIADWRKEQEMLKKEMSHEMTTTWPRKGSYGCTGQGKRERENSLLAHDHVEPSVESEEGRFFDFDTTNLYCCGSPAGFFLLLNRAMLLPRRGRKKVEDYPSAENDPNIVGERGTYGCLSVDNIYNVMHYSDPISYRLNPTVDAEYADNVKIQPIPSTTSTLFESLGSTIRSVLPGGGSSTNINSSALLLDAASRPPPNLSRLPSTIELETHDFTREEIAEKRLALLNDNGTMDWYVGSSGGWVLENQYVNMLGAHSSYWESRDFARFIVMEAGRQPGRKGVRANVRAVKVRAR
ncbi:DDHD domain-containing protein [Kalaharituber pfeilii]|nr:DDHD domain-containing protein [Kalaharituber pfeilii]